ncbi:MAG TPA: transporter [Vicinamibacterales bacterium]|jgi:hypothetical protein|nr:transporter [Vicinamibacterales bacterium]
MQLVAPRAVLVPFAIAVFAFVTPSPARAQLNTQHLKGSAGLKAGSQPPPGGYVIAPILYFYSADTVKDRDGNEAPNPRDGTLNASLFGAGYSHVTTKKVLGGFYGFQFLFPVGANNRIQGTEIDADPGAGLTDSVVQPLSLGWHFKRADANAGYLIYIPTGRYSNGADDNTGFGMWGQEFTFGTTAYLTENRQYHAATIASFTFSSKKEDSETQPGAQMNLEGGVGGDFLKGGLSVGLAYYANFKLSDDEIEGLPGILIRGKNKVFALGPDVTLALARKGTVYGFVRVNYQWEVYARTTTQGGSWNIALTWLTKPLKAPAQ